MTAREAVALLKARKVSPNELITASLARTAQVDATVNALPTLCEDRARAAAAKVDPDSLLAGLPFGVKDLNPVAGVRTTWGTRAFADHVPTTTDPVIARIERRGGIVTGKTNTPEMGAGANTFNAVFGPTFNAWDTRLNAGGSSGGAAVSLATGQAWLSHGSDLGGSLRTPASFNGIVGLRPSPGIVGSGSAADTFNPMPVDGPMARTVADVALFLDAMAGFDPISPLSYPAPETSYLATCLADPGPVRIAFSPDLNGLGPVTSEVADVLRRGMETVQGPGIHVVEETPDIRDIDRTFRTLRALGFWTSARITPDHVTRHYKPTLQQNIAEGRALTVDEVAEALVARTKAYEVMRDFLARFDVLALPVNGIAPGPQEQEFPPEIAGVPSRDYLDWLRFAFVATLCGLPALSLPIGFTPSGMPLGIQLIGPPRGEGRLLQIARVLEERLDLRLVPIDPIVKP
nr:amidase family protein [Thalassococcus arenae]